MNSANSNKPSFHVVDNYPTRAFLAAHRGARRSIDTERPGFRRFRSWFTRPLLSRPAFLDADEVRRLDHDLPLLLRTLHALPDRLFGGDEEAFARALGWTQPGLAPVLRLLSGPAVPLGRADLVRGPAGFELVEFNTSSSLGSLEFGELCRAMLSDPAFSDFANRTALDYVDPMRLMVGTLLETAGLDPSDRPAIALLDWTSSPVDVDASLFVGMMTDLGFTMVICTVDDLEYREDGLYAGDARIDVVYRTFLLKTVAEDPAALELLAPLAAAVRDGKVGLFSPLNADLYGTKTCMAMLSDDRNRAAFNAAELEVIDRVLPWTRRMTEKGAIAGDAESSLIDYVLAQQEELVLKPGIGHAGRGVVAGWMVSPAEWKSHVLAAVDGNYIVQRRAPSVAERFYGAAADEPPSAYFLHWGLFVTGAGLSGGFIKGLPDREQDIRYLGDGSHVGCIFHIRTGEKSVQY